MVDKFEEFYDNNSFILGRNVEEFEKQYAAFCETKYCIGVANGLDALVLCLKALNIKSGDEVIVPSNTYIATWLAVSIVGATPIPVEPRLTTYNLNPDLIQGVITKRTRAIIPVHLYGQPCEMDSIVDIAKRFNLSIIEDNAQAQGATYNNKITGSFGIVNATSFYPGKNLGALGDAGAITTDSEELSKRVASLRNYGSEKKYYNEVKGVNSRLDELQAGFLSIKLNCIQEWNEQRNAVALKYNDRLNGVGDLIIPSLAEGAKPVYHLYVVRTKSRKELQEYLLANGIGTMIHYPIPPHLQKAYADHQYKKNDFQIAEQIADTCLSLPIYPGLSDASIDFIVSKISEFY